MTAGVLALLQLVALALAGETPWSLNETKKALRAAKTAGQVKSITVYILQDPLIPASIVHSCARTSNLSLRLTVSGD
jgi:hypothetical protein